MRAESRGLHLALIFTFGAAPVLAALWFYAFTDWSELASRLPQRATGLFVVAAFAGGLAVLRGAQGRVRVKAPALVLGAVFGLAALAGLALNTPDPGIAVYSLVPKAFHLAAGIPLLLILQAQPGDLARRLMMAFLVGLGAHALLTLAMIGTLSGTPGHDLVFSPPGMFHIRVWGMMLATGISAGLGLSIGFRGLQFWLWLGAMACLAALMFWTGTRAAPLALLGSVGLTALLAGPKGWRFFGAGLAVCVIGALLSLMLSAPHSSWGFFNSMAETTDAADLNQLSAGRLSLWSQAIELIAQKPLLGHGYHQFAYLREPPFESFTHPHNAPLNFLLSFGLVGGGALIGLLLVLWRLAIIRFLADPNPTRLAAFTALNTLLALSLVGGVFFRLETLMATGVFWAIAVAESASVDRS